MQPEKGDERQIFVKLAQPEGQADERRGDVCQKPAQPQIFGERQHERDGSEQVCRGKGERHRLPDDHENRRQRTGNGGQRDGKRSLFHGACRRRLSAAAAGVEAAVERHVAGAAGGALLAEAAAHLLLVVIVGGRLRLRLLFGIFGAVLVVLDLFLQLIVRIAVFFVGRIELHGDLELFFALVHPVLFIEHHRLQVMPLRGAFVELVERALRLVDLAIADELFHLRIGRIGVLRAPLFLAFGHDLGIGDLDAAEQFRSLVARLPFEETLFGILLFQLLIARGDLFVRRVFGYAQQVVVLFVHFPSFCSDRSEPDFIGLCPLCPAEDAPHGGGQPAQDDVVRQIVIEMKSDLREMFPVFRINAAEDKIHLFPALFQHLFPAVAAVCRAERVIVFLADVFVKIVQSVCKVHPLADAVQQRAGVRGRIFFQAGIRQVDDHLRKRIRRAVYAGTVFFFQRRKRRHVLFRDLREGGVQRARLLISLPEKGTRRFALPFVLDVVGQLVIGEHGIEAGDSAGDVVVAGDGPLRDRMQDAVLLFDLYVRPHYIVQQGGQKCHVIGERHARALAAAAADTLAKAAVQRLVQHAVLDVHMRDIRLNIAEHFSLFSLIKAHLAIDLRKRFAREAERPFRALFQNVCEVSLIREQARLFSLNGRERVGDRLAHGELEISVALARKFLLRLRDALPREGAVDGEEVGDPRFRFGIITHFGIAVGDGALEFAHDRIPVVVHRDEPVGIFVRFAHLAGRVGKAHHARAAAFGDISVGDGERLPVAVVEADRKVAREFKVLLLVCPDGHERRLIEQDVRRHEDGVIHQPHVDVVGVPDALVFELRHAGKFAGIGNGVEHPHKLAVCGNVRLHEQHALFGVDAAGEEERGKPESIFTQRRRLLPHGDGVQIRDRIDAVVFVLQFREITDGADIVAYRDRAARLNGGKKAALLRCFHDAPLTKTIVSLSIPHAAQKCK